MVAHNHNFAADYATSTSVSLLDEPVTAKVRTIRKTDAA